MKRRDFIKVTAGAVLTGAMFLPAGCAPGEGGKSETDMAENKMKKSIPNIGLQLYTVRSLMEADFAGTLRKVAEIGYREVEFAGYFDQDPGEVKVLLDELGLTAPAAHVPLEMITGNLDHAIAAAQIIGHRYLVVPWLGEEQRTPEGYQALAAALNSAGEAAQNAGVRIAYHNHDFEFEMMDGQPAYDRLLAETDPALVDMELDLYWINKAGHDPLAYFARYPGRFPCCHVKDMGEVGKMVDVGRGRIDFAAIFAKSAQAGLKHYFVEHDQPEKPLESIRNSYQYLSKLTF